MAVPEGTLTTADLTTRYRSFAVSIRVGINGFGRIGRLAFRHACANEGIEIVGINDLVPIEYMAYLLRYDSTHGRFQGSIQYSGNQLIVNGKSMRISAERDPAQLRWAELDVDVIMEDVDKLAALAQECDVEYDGWGTYFQE